jgi:hypothetical protein
MIGSVGDFRTVAAQNDGTDQPKIEVRPMPQSRRPDNAVYGPETTREIERAVGPERRNPRARVRIKSKSPR